MIVLFPSNIHDPILFDIGDDWLIVVRCTNTDGTPMDLTNVQSIEWKFATMTSNTPLFTLTLGAGIEIEQVDLPAKPDTCVIWLPHANTVALLPGFYRDQLRVTTADGLVSVQMKGRIEAISTI